MSTRVSHLKSSGPARLRRSSRLFQMQVADKQVSWSVDSSAPRSTWMSNTERCKSAETMQKSISYRWPKEFLHQVYLCAHHSVGRKCCCSSKGTPLSFTSASLCLPITSKHNPVSFPVYALKPPRTADSLLLIIRKVSLVSSTNSVYDPFEFGPYICQAWGNRNRLQFFE